MDVRERSGELSLRMCADEAEQAWRGQRHPHPRCQALDPLVIGERRESRLERIVLALQHRAALDRATQPVAQLENLHLHRDEPHQQHAEHRDPCPASNEAVDQGVVR
jgi:hypothetical protein